MDPTSHQCSYYGNKDKRDPLPPVLASCVFFLPIFSPGHLIPMVEAAKRLLHWSDSFSITFLLMHPPSYSVTSAISTSYLQSTESLGLPINFHQLPSVDPPATFDSPEEFNSVYTQLHKPHIKSAISTSSSPASALVVDLFATAAIDVAKELNVQSYVYFTSSLTLLAIMFHLPSLPPDAELDFWETDEELRVTGLTPIPALSVPMPLMSSKLGTFRWFVHHARRYTETDGIIVNSNADLEPIAMEALAAGQTEVFPVGPIISFSENGSKERHECLKWLDKQLAKSVVFLCFGSRGAFDPPQVEEMAAGLERSGCRFLWVLRAPEGFLEKTQERGMVWPSRVPQLEILAHVAVGAFLSHCGWNSTIESLWFGVPLIPWPIFAEQHLNAFEMVSEMRVAVGMKMDRKNNNFVTGDELERAFRCLMDEGSETGRQIRANAEEIKAACRKSVEQGGSSYVNWRRLAPALQISCANSNRAISLLYVIVNLETPCKLSLQDSMIPKLTQPHNVKADLTAC